MSNKRLSKKEYRRRFSGLLAETTELLATYVKTLGEYDDALDRGKPVDMVIETAMLDAEDDYKFSLFALHEFLVRTGYVPFPEESDLSAPSSTHEPFPTTSLK